MPLRSLQLTIILTCSLSTRNGLLLQAKARYATRGRFFFLKGHRQFRTLTYIVSGWRTADRASSKELSTRNSPEDAEFTHVARNKRHGGRQTHSQTSTGEVITNIRSPLIIAAACRCTSERCPKQCTYMYYCWHTGHANFDGLAVRLRSTKQFSYFGL